MKATTQDWLKLAEIDLRSSRKLLEDDFLTNSVAFHFYPTMISVLYLLKEIAL